MYHLLFSHLDPQIYNIYLLKTDLPNIVAGVSLLEYNEGKLGLCVITLLHILMLSVY